MLQKAHIATLSCYKRPGKSYETQREATLRRRGMIWVGVLLGLVILGYLVPFTVLSGVEAWYGSFLFWIVFALAAIGLNVAITSRWRD